MSTKNLLKEENARLREQIKRLSDEKDQLRQRMWKIQESLRDRFLQSADRYRECEKKRQEHGAIFAKCREESLANPEKLAEYYRYRAVMFRLEYALNQTMMDVEKICNEVLAFGLNSDSQIGEFREIHERVSGHLKMIAEYKKQTIDEKLKKNQILVESLKEVGEDTFIDVFCDQCYVDKVSSIPTEFMNCPERCKAWKDMWHEYIQYRTISDIRFLHKYSGRACSHRICSGSTFDKMDLQFAETVRDKCFARKENGDLDKKLYCCSICGTFTKMLCPECKKVRFCETCWPHKYKEHLESCSSAGDDV